jgi:uncharacterized protein
MLLVRFLFPSIVVVSTNDPYVKLARAEFFAKSWGSRFVTIARAGHINANSGLGEWTEGQKLLQELLREALPTVGASRRKNSYERR